MPATVAGLPTHVLIVHAVVVLLPITVVATLALAIWPAARARFGLLTVGLALVATGAVPLATSSGEALQARIPRTQLIAKHTSIADQLVPWAALLGLALAAMVAVDIYRRAQAGRIDGGLERWLHERVLSRALHRVLHPVSAGRLPRVAATVTAVAVVAALGTGVEVIRIGDSGARAAWTHTARQAGG